jgi:ferritin
MISTKIQEAFNKQINKELYSAYLYLAMASHCESVNLRGFSGWLKVQAKEEIGHAMKFFSHISARGGKAILQALEAPQSEWKTPLAIFEAAYDHEKKITASINELVRMAEEEKDYASADFLQWFVSEQVEEEFSTLDVVKKIKMIGDSSGALFMLDHELGKRKAD